MPESRAEGDQGFTVQDKRAARRLAEEATGQTAPETPAPPRAETPPTTSSSAPPGGQPDLSSLFLMLGTSALIHLGEAPDPVTGQPAPDLAQAKYAIDLLGLLKDKTDGRRSSEESQILDGLLYDLRMRYLQVTRMI